jgi:hypothetical protein
MRKLAVLLVTIGLTGILAACGDTSASGQRAAATIAATPSPANKTSPAADYEYYGITRGKPGQNLIYYTYTFRVLESRRNPTFEHVPPAAPGNTLLAVYFWLNSADEEGAFINPDSFYVQDSAGNRYLPRPAAEGVAPDFYDQYGYISDGDRMRGWLTFELPATASGLTFHHLLVLDGVNFTVEL